MPQNDPSFAPVSSRYPIRIPIRMTQAERASIGKRATALNRSISRYLVELATRDRAQLLPEDRARIQFLIALFAGATQKVQAALASSRLSQSSEPDIASVRVCLQEVLRLLEAIGQELGRRLV